MCEQVRKTQRSEKEKETRRMQVGVGRAGKLREKESEDGRMR